MQRRVFGGRVVGMTTRIGLIIPSSNRMVEEEMVRHLPPGFVAHVVRLRMTGAHRASIDAIIPRVAEAAAAPGCRQSPSRAIAGADKM